MEKSSTTNGFHYLLQGFHWLIRPGIKRFVVIPLLINTILFALFLGFGFQLVHHLTGLLPHWLHWLEWLIYPLFFVASSVIMLYTFTILANLLGAPFNSLLSEKIYTLKTGQKPNPNENLKEAIKNIPRSLHREWQIIKYFLLRAIILLILYFIPGINIVASILWFVFGCWMMAIQYVDYPFDNQKKPFKEIHPFLKKRCGLSFTFGLAVVLLSMIPIINFIVMPAAVIGATLLYIEHTK